MQTIKSLLSIVVLFTLMTLGIGAATGDLWTARGSLSSVFRDLLRVTSAGHFVPGQTAVQNCGTSSLKWAAIYGNDIVADRFRLSQLAVSANTTMTTASNHQVLLGALAGNITLTIPSAATEGAGAIVDVQDKGGVLDATHTTYVNSTSGNINGAAGVNISTAYSGKRFVSDGTNWFSR